MSINYSNQEGWIHFLKLCQQAKTTERLDAIFSLFLTAEEKQQLTMRISLIQELLAAQKTQREIARELKLSIAKITRGSNALKIISNELRTYLVTELVEKNR